MTTVMDNLNCLGQYPTLTQALWRRHSWVAASSDLMADLMWRHATWSAPGAELDLLATDSQSSDVEKG